VKNNRVLSVALKKLGRKNYSEKEFREKLLKNFPSDQVDETIARIKKFGYLNDRELALYLTEDYLRKNKEYYYILSKLKQRKIREDVTEEIKNKFDFKREMEAADDFFSRNVKRKKKNTLFMNLKSRGFSNGTVSEIMKRYFRQRPEEEYDKGKFTPGKECDEPLDI
jgi:regulatory protein